MGDGSSTVEQPEHEHHSVDNSILDYESDGSYPDTHTSHAAYKLPLSTAMETDVERVAAVLYLKILMLCTTSVNLPDLPVKRTPLLASPRTIRSGELLLYSHPSLVLSRITVTLLKLITVRESCVVIPL